MMRQIRALRQARHPWRARCLRRMARVRALPVPGVVTLHPLMGGLDPDLAWQSLERLRSEVVPALASGT
jgi:hypothetical protein